MKKIIKYLFLLTGGSFILTSCNDFLDREPLDSVTPDNFFFTENDLAAYAVKHYNFTTHEGFNAGIWKNDNATDNQAATNYDKKYPVNGKFRKLMITLQATIRGILQPFVKLIILSKQSFPVLKKER